MGLRSSDYFLVHSRPLILAYAGARDVRRDIDKIKRMSPRPVVLEHVSWWTAAPERMQRSLDRQKWLAARGIEHHLMVNTGDENEMRIAYGVRGAWCSKNLFCNEHVFDIARGPVSGSPGAGDSSPFRALGVEGKFDAVYTAQLKPYKRLELAREIKALLVISYGGDLKKFCPELSHAIQNKRWMPESAVASSLRHSHCGLALSEEEGQNNATVEYFLCGIPVVSTPSKGGRDLFLDSQNSLIVAPEAGAVAEAARHFKTHEPSPESIRSGVLDRIRESRTAFCEYVRGVLEGRDVHASTAELLDRLFGPPGDEPSRFIASSSMADPGSAAAFESAVAIDPA